MHHFVDTHAHLYVKQFRKDQAAVLDQAALADIRHIFLPNIDSGSIDDLYALADAAPDRCFPCMGVHPCSIKADFESELDRAYKELTTSGRQFYAVGEIGLDFYWDLTFKEEQKEALKRQIEWAKQLKLPIILHCRESIDETLEIVEAMNDDSLTGVFHCFGGTLEQAERIMKLGGFYMGLGGVLTYKKSKELAELVKVVPLAYFVLETDAPYLAPEPYRSSKDKSKKRNQPAYMVKVAEKLAELRAEPLSKIAEQTTRNAYQLFQVEHLLEAAS